MIGSQFNLIGPTEGASDMLKADLKLPPQIRRTMENPRVTPQDITRINPRSNPSKKGTTGNDRSGTSRPDPRN